MDWDVTDPQHRAVLSAARSWGVSPSRFLGVEPRIVYTYSDSGMVHSAQSAPEWTDEDRDAALALAAYEGTLCPGCRAPLDETTAPENEFRYRTATLLCHRCVATDIASNANQSHPHPNALMISAMLRGSDA